MHGGIDAHKITMSAWPEQKNLTKDDYLIICGDFGCIWDGSHKDEWWLNWFARKPFTTLVCFGNHENYDIIFSKYPIVEMFGNFVFEIRENVFGFLRGAVYEIAGKTFFTLGGAVSIDRHLRKEGVSWWSQEMPSYQEFQDAFDALEEHDWNVDYVITHCAPSSVQTKICDKYKYDKLTDFLNYIDKATMFKHWYFGHYHIDYKITENHTAIYNKIIELEV